MTESEEMYLVTIARLQEQGTDIPLPLANLAEELSVLPVSVNQMIRKLEDSGWVTYTPYRGVELTDQGRDLALQILRRRRLWEVFLVFHLNTPILEAKEIACRMEHFFTAGATERLASFLGNPERSPQGLLIPSPVTTVIPVADTPLGALLLNDSGTVTRIETDLARKNFLYGEGILPGETVQVIAIGSGGSLLLKNSGGRCIQLSAEIVQGVWVLRQAQSTSTGLSKPTE